MSILDGATIVAKNYVSFPDSGFNTEEQIQPNGVDLRVGAVYLVQGHMDVSRDEKVAFDGSAQPVPLKEGWWEIRPQAGGLYLVDFLEDVHVADGFCAQIITRSSLVRAGVDTVTGLWDTGFEGKLGASLRVITPFRLQYGARIAQVMFYESQFSGHRYAGRYQKSNSQTALAT